jgi:peptidoglycan/xylan/chitin deacetylase (PgdA/CDA1 family)
MRLLVPLLTVSFVGFLGCSDAGSGGSDPAGGSGTGGADSSGSGSGTAGGSGTLTGSSGAGGAVSTGGSGGGGTSGGGGAGGGGAGGGAPSDSVFRVDGVATWRANAKAAYTIIHDDLCDPTTFGSFDHSDPLLVARGLHAGFGANPNTCNTESKWPAVKTLVNHGHDVFNHSWDHACIGDMTACGGNKYSANLVLEIDQAGQLIQMQTGIAPRFFIFPYDVCGTTAIAHLQQAGYIGARCGAHAINPSAFTNGFAVQFDVWGPNFSIYAASGPCQGKTKPDQASRPSRDLPVECRMYVLNQFVDDAITKGGWANREMHGFDDNPGSWEPISVSDYTAHLDHVKAKVDTGDLWMEGPTRIVKYRFAREKCSLPTVSTGNTLKFAAPSADCAKYATALSFLISTTDGSDPAALRIRQGTTDSPAKRLSAGHYVVDADPSKGDAVLLN